MDEIYKDMNELDARVPNLGLTGVLDALADMKGEVEKTKCHSNLQFI